MTERLHLSPKHRAVIESLLREHLPGVEVWAHGSRVNGRSHDGSDLDLVLRGSGLQEIPVGLVADFEEAVRDSSIPFLVKARDWARLPERFHREIERGYVVLVGKVEQDQLAAPVETVYGRFPSGFLEGRLANLCDSDGGIQTGPFGSQLHQEDYVSVGTPIVTVEHLGENRILHRNLPCVSDYDRDRLSKYALRRGDVVFSRVGSVDRRALVREPEEGWLFSGRCLRVRPDSAKIDSRYLSYFFGLSTFQAHIRSIAVGATMPSLNTQLLSDVTIFYPPLPEQRAIAHILGTLDDKIELNRRMNETLEAMARALFKSWFVDFDPVRAKAALRNHAAHHSPDPITPPLRGSRGDKGASPQASRRGETGAPPPPRPWSDIKRQYTSKALQHAQAMRQSQTNAEGLLWYYLRNKQLGGYKFRRQQPIGPYIADFACLPEKLLIELDGGQHADPNAPDEQRDRFLQQQGYRVLRFWNHEVFADCFGVLESIYAALTHHPPLEGGSKDASLSGRGSPPPLQPAPDGLASATPPQGGSDWSVDRARAYLDSMDPDIAALFPDRFVDSELGEIPAGWEVGILDDIVELHSGGTPRTSVPDYWDGDIPWYTAKDAPALSDVFVLATERKITQAGVENSAAKILPAGTTIITARGTVGRLACLGIPMAMNQTCYGIRGADGYPEFFIYWSIRTVVDELQRRTHGTIFDTITRQTFKLVETTVVPVEVTRAFEVVVKPVMERILKNMDASGKVAALRDALLPKLVSGKVVVGKHCPH